MRDTLLGLALAAQTDEGLALKIEDVLLGHRLRCGDRATGYNVSELCERHGVVIRSISPARII